VARAAAYADRVPRFRKEAPASGDEESSRQKWRRRLLRGTEQTPQAELQQAQDILEWALRKHDEDSSFVLKAKLDVANQLAKLDRVAEEVILMEQVVASLRVHTPEGLKTASAEMQLAGCFVALGRLGDASPLLAHVVEIRLRELGEDDPETQRAEKARSFVADQLGGTG
jgi:hypothetical protein